MAPDDHSDPGPVTRLLRVQHRHQHSGSSRPSVSQFDADCSIGVQGAAPTETAVVILEPRGQPTVGYLSPPVPHRCLRNHEDGLVSVLDLECAPGCRLFL
jgi:hypothetical protein